jgi:uncharacterized protein YycO
MTRLVEQLLENPDVNQVIANLLTEVRLKKRTSRKKPGLSTREAHSKITKTLQPGDVVIVGPDVVSKLGATTRAFYNVSKRLSAGSDKNTHVDMYAGKKKLLTAMAGKGVIAKKVGYLAATRNHITILRPRVSRKDKMAAVAFAEKQLGKGFSYVNIGGALVKELASGAPAPSKESTFTCSGLIARAYPKLAIGKDKKNRCLATPSDFRKSRDFVKVIELDRANRKDKFQITR